MGQNRVVSRLMIIIIFLLLTVINVHVSWSDEDCPREEGYYERPVGDCEKMGGAFVCQQTCLSTFREFLRATCDYSDTQTHRTFQYPCRCCIKQQMSFLPGQEYRGEEDSLPPEEWIPSRLSPSELIETYFELCPESQGFTPRIMGDCQIIGRPLCIQICHETFRDLHSAFCDIEKYMEEKESYVSNCVCCYTAPLTPGSEILPVENDQTKTMPEETSPPPPNA